MLWSESHKFQKTKTNKQKKTITQVKERYSKNILKYSTQVNIPTVHHWKCQHKNLEKLN